MAKYREEAEREAARKAEGKAERDAESGDGNKGIETIPKACPICKGDVKGDDIYLYFCRHCNILYKRIELAITEERIEYGLKKTLAEKYGGELKIGHEKIALKRVKSGKSKKTEASDIPEVPPPIEYVASKTSNKLHMSSCPFAKNINKSNKLTFKSLKEAKKYKRCRCIE